MAVQKIGNIEVRTDKDVTFKSKSHGIETVIVSPVTGDGWHLPLENISPQDLRDLANLIEGGVSHKEKLISHCEEQGLKIYITTTRYQDMTTHEKLDFGFKKSREDFLDDENNPLTEIQLEYLTVLNCVSVYSLECIKTYSLGY